MRIILKSLLSICTLITLQGAAQTLPADRDLGAFSWEISFPTSNKFIDETSLSGWRFEYRKGIRKDLSVGIAISWSAFEEFVDTKTYSSSDNARAITTDMIRQVYAVPITIIGHYYPSTKSKMLEPYLGLGLGTQYVENKAFLNIYELNDNNWGFVARPEVGTLVKFSSNSPVKALLGLGYNISTNKNETFDVNGWHHLTINVGIGFGAGF